MHIYKLGEIVHPIVVNHPTIFFLVVLADLSFGEEFHLTLRLLSGLFDFVQSCFLPLLLGLPILGFNHPYFLGMSLGHGTVLNLADPSGIPDALGVFGMPYAVEPLGGIESAVVQEDLVTSWMLGEVRGSIVQVPVNQHPTIQIIGVFGVFVPCDHLFSHDQYYIRSGYWMLARLYSQQSIIWSLDHMKQNQPIPNLFEPSSRPMGTRSRSRRNHNPVPYSSTTYLTSTQNISSKQLIDMPSLELQRRQYSMTDQQISGDIVKVLRQQNTNLKEQNNFLLNKLRLTAQKESEIKELAGKQKQIVDALKMENLELKNEFEYVNQLANSKVEQFGKKLAKLSCEQSIVEKNIDIRDLNPPKGILQLRSVQSQSGPVYGMDQSDNMVDNPKSLQDLKNQFQAILYSCKVEKDNHKRKEYRKRLVELTYKMKQLRE